MTSSSNDAYKVPPEVLMTAIQARTGTDTLTMSWTWTLNNSASVWSIYFHFVELQLQENNIREVTVNVHEFMKTVTLQNLQPKTVAFSSIAGRSLDMTIEAKANSTLPPLLNAVEIFTVAQLPNSPTFLDDFNAMYDVKKTYGVTTASWQGDPCLPTNYSWSGLHCSYDSSPRIDSLNLSSSGLKGLIATSISNLKAVVSLDLSNNSLTGSIPDVLAQLPSLKVLNLTGNNLNGSVPQTLLKKKADGSLLLRCYYYYYAYQLYQRIYWDIKAQLLMVVHHRNLVSLIGYCEEFENMALIYEFMFNGNVQQHLSAQNPNVLSWSQRLQIAIDAAQGLEYLHNGCKPPIVHRDLKTSNILLNKDLQAKIADFGLSKAFVTENDSHISTRPSGTPGYLDPESSWIRGYKGGSAPTSARKLVEAAMSRVAVTANERPNMNPHAVGAEGMLDSFWARCLMIQGILFCFTLHACCL
ncbi:hypothetical protein NL676_006714 [Syzygium grande]|nr:hypothetical protein NL676_006714 [Syzygium grande]